MSEKKVEKSGDKAAKPPTPQSEEGAEPVSLRSGKTCLKVTTRPFLNHINSLNLSSCRVFTVPCLSMIGNDDVELHPPKDKGYKEFWVDFSYKTKTIHSVIDGGSEWNCIILKPKSVKEIIYSREQLEKENNKEVICLEIYLISPLSIVSQEKHFKLQSLNISFQSGEILQELLNKFLSVCYTFLGNLTGRGNGESVSIVDIKTGNCEEKEGKRGEVIAETKVEPENDSPFPLPVKLP